MELKDYYQWMQFEHELINHRITWLLTSQSLFFTAFALATSKGIKEMLFLLKTMSAVGFLLSLAIFLGICGSYVAKFTLRKNYGNEIRNPKIPVGVSTPATMVTMITELLLPVLFAIAWVCIFNWLKTF
jgi:hypothetical protein